MQRRPRKGKSAEIQRRNDRRKNVSTTLTPASTFADLGNPAVWWARLRSQGGADWLLALVLVAAVFLAYQPAWHGDFLWDDDTHLTNNPVLQPGGLIQTWIPGNYASYWPLTYTVYRLEFEAWGLNPLGYHLVNIALHALSALMLWRILARLRVPGGLFAAAIFALHPVNVESVAWITQLKNTFSLFLGLSSTYFYLRNEEESNWRRLALSLGLFFLSALAKGMVLTLPVVLLACTWWQRGSLRRRDLLRILPYLAIAALMVGMEIYQQRVASGGSVVRSDSLMGRTAVAGCAVWFYLWKLICPINLMFIYPRWNISDHNVAAYLPGALLLVILALAWWQRHRPWGRVTLMFLVGYVILLLPALGFVNIFFMQYSLVSDHWQYAAMIVPCAVFAGIVSTAGRRWFSNRLFGYGFTLGLLTVLGILTFRQSETYTDLETLYRTTLDRNPSCWMFQNNLGNLLTDQGRYLEAIEHYHKALEIDPHYADAHYNLGLAFAHLGRFEEAISSFQETLKIKPDYSQAPTNLAAALARQGRYEEAVTHYHNILDHYSDDIAALNGLAWLRATCPTAAFRNGSEAVELAERAVRLSKGQSPTILDTLAAAYAEVGRFADAAKTARQAVNLAKRQGQMSLANSMKARIRLYEAKAPYREKTSASPQPENKPRVIPDTKSMPSS